VKSYLERNRKSLYMIIGLKIGENANIVHRDGEGLSKQDSLALLSVHPMFISRYLSGNRQTYQDDSFQILDPFVMAYRVRGKYNRRSVQLRIPYFTKGTMMHNLDDLEAQLEMEMEPNGLDETELAYEWCELAGKDLEERAMKWNKKVVRESVTDGEEEFRCIMLSDF